MPFSSGNYSPLSKRKNLNTISKTSLNKRVNQKKGMHQQFNSINLQLRGGLEQSTLDKSASNVAPTGLTISIKSMEQRRLMQERSSIPQVSLNKLMPQNDGL